MPRWILLSLLTYSLVVLGLATLQGALLGLAIPLLIYLGAALLARPQEPQLTVQRQLSSDRIARGMPVLVTLSVTNGGAQAITLLLKDMLPHGLRVVDGTPQLLAALAPSATAELSYTITGERGFYHFSALQAAVEDTLGLFQHQIRLPAPGRLFIVPDVVRLRSVEIRPRRTQVYSGHIPAHQGGPGIEFFGVREYQPGDPTRWLNGRATARHEQALFVNEFEQERVADVGLILDTRRQSDVESPDSALFEYSVQAAAALADALLNRGNRVGLLMYGRALDWTLPGYGKLQRERILRSLARAETGDLPVFERLDYFPTRLFPARSQLVLISPLLPHDPQMLNSLRARGYQLLVISPDPVAFEQQALAGERAVAQATRIARIERDLLLRRCRQTGVVVIDWKVDQPFQQVAEAALSRSPLLMRAMGVAQ